MALALVSLVLVLFNIIVLVPWREGLVPISDDLSNNLTNEVIMARADVKTDLT